MVWKSQVVAHAAAGGSMEGHPTGNRNAIAALIPFVPDLGDWILYLEDDMFLTRQETKNKESREDENVRVFFLRE